MAQKMVLATMQWVAVGRPQVVPALHRQRVGRSTPLQRSCKCTAQKSSVLKLSTEYTAPFGDSLLLVSDQNGWSAEDALFMSWTEVRPPLPSRIHPQKHPHVLCVRSKH